MATVSDMDTGSGARREPLSVDEMRRVAVVTETVVNYTATMAEGRAYDADEFREGLSITIHEDAPHPAEIAKGSEGAEIVREATEGDQVSLEMDVVGLDAAVANAIRRAMLAEVPTMAIESVLITDNTSVIQDEVLAHRLGLIPIVVDPALFNYPPADGTLDLNADDAAETMLLFSLDVACEEIPGVPEDAPDSERYANSMVTSGNLTWVPIGDQAETIGSMVAPHPVSDSILLAKLRPGQRIDLEVRCVKGVGRDHAKFSPSAPAFYRLLPEIVMKKEARGAKAEELVNACPMGVFDIEDAVAVVSEPRNCTVCRECVRGEWAEYVELRRVKNHFIYSIETTGVLPRERIFKDAVNVLKAKVSACLGALTSTDSGAGAGGDDIEDMEP